MSSVQAGIQMNQMPELGWADIISSFGECLACFWEDSLDGTEVATIHSLPFITFFKLQPDAASFADVTHIHVSATQRDLKNVL